MSNRGSLALEIWDYFYSSNHPARGDEKPWATIERATDRIRASEMYMDESRAPDVRLRSARRVRAAARLALREIPRLSRAPDPAIIYGLAAFESIADDVIQAVSEVARQVVLH